MKRLGSHGLGQQLSRSRIRKPHNKVVKNLSQQTDATRKTYIQIPLEMRLVSDSLIRVVHLRVRLIVRVDVLRASRSRGF